VPETLQFPSYSHAGELLMSPRHAGAYGYFEVTNDVSRYTDAPFLCEVGQRTDVFVRFGRSASIALHPAAGPVAGQGAAPGADEADANETPIFFVPEPVQHAGTSRCSPPSEQPENVWDYLVLPRDTTTERGIETYVPMNTLGTRTFRWVNEDGDEFWARNHFRTVRPIRCAGPVGRFARPAPHNPYRDLMRAIEAGEYPAWVVGAQIVPLEEATKLDWTPFDTSREWPFANVPVIEIGRLVLDRSPGDYRRRRRARLKAQAAEAAGLARATG
jgi:catalase